MKKKVIGIVGKIAAGKDLAADYLAEKYSIKKYVISSILKQILKEKGEEETRENMINLSRELSKIKGEEYLARKLLEGSKEDFLLVVGMRQVKQIEYLRENSDFTLISIEASDEIRFERMKKRGKIGEDISFEGFEKIEKKEDKGGVQKVSKCMSMADIKIKNEGEINDFLRELDKKLDI